MTRRSWNWCSPVCSACRRHFPAEAGHGLLHRFQVAMGGVLAVEPYLLPVQHFTVGAVPGCPPDAGREPVTVELNAGVVASDLTKDSPAVLVVVRIAQALPRPGDPVLHGERLVPLERLRQKYVGVEQVIGDLAHLTG